MAITLTITDLFLITAIFSGLQFLSSIWIKSRLEGSIKHEYDRLLEEYKYEIEIRKQAARVSEYLALARRLKADSGDPDFEKANQLSWELAMWLPADIYRSMTKAIVNPSLSVNPLTVSVEVRRLLLGGKAGDLKPEDIAHHAPHVGEHTSSNR